MNMCDILSLEKKLQSLKKTLSYIKKDKIMKESLQNEIQEIQKTYCRIYNIIYYHKNIAKIKKMRQIRYQDKEKLKKMNAKYYQKRKLAGKIPVVYKKIDPEIKKLNKIKKQEEKKEIKRLEKIQKEVKRKEAKEIKRKKAKEKRKEYNKIYYYNKIKTKSLDN